MTPTASIEQRHTARINAQRWATPQVDPRWWTTGWYEGRPLSEALNHRDMGVVFRFLRSRGFSTTAITMATGLSANRVRAVARGDQSVASYDVLRRIADGLSIDRGLMGMAYVHPR